VKPPAGTPLRLGAIDVGSNAIRFLAAEVADDGSQRLLESERLAVRLGGDVFTKLRALSPETMDAGVAALSRIRRRIDDLGIVNYRAVATSAVRESRNGGEFVERVRRESGIHLETISGSEESHLVWLAVRGRVPLGPSRWLMMDLGGGSVEVSVVDRDGILWTESHTLGSVRLLQAFEEEEASKDYQELLERYAHSLKVPSAVAEWNPVGAIATGGNIEALADLAGVSRGADGVSVLSVEDLRRVMNKLSRLKVEDRVKKLGLREDRADVIVPAAVVYERVAELSGAREILVPRVGLKEGILLDLTDELQNRSAHSDRRDRELRAAAVSLGRRFHFDEAHAQQVSRLALALFDQLEPLHGLGGKERRLLLAGALLHDIGKVDAYSWDRAFEHTARGRLYGHVVLGALRLDQRVGQTEPAVCTRAELDLLQHLILSHHGQLEFGAPVEPMTLEAQLLPHADDASARGDCMAQALRSPDNFMGDDPVSRRTIWQLDHRRIFRGKSTWGL
jgi:exopolyphosphatase/guanosine-5'-triphosphate,3'-diphosphate pyrophosphatase